MTSAIRQESCRVGAKARCIQRAASQDGLLAVAQALEEGMSRWGVSRQVRAGLWRKVLPGVVDVTGRPLSERRRWRAALLWGGPGAALCLRSAARAWGILESEVGEVDLFLPVRRPSPAPWLKTHCRSGLARSHFRTVAGIRATDVHQTLLELGSAVSEDELEEAVHMAITKGLTSAAYLRKRLDLWARRGRPGLQAVRRVLEDVQKAGGVPQSRFETRLFRLLRAARLPMPVPQYEIVGGDGALIARPDFAYPHHKVVIEAFSYEWHGRKGKSLHDARRRNRLAALGWVVLDIAWEDLVAHPEEVIAVVAGALGVRSLDM